MDDVEIENQHEEEGENRGEDHVEVGPEFKSSYLKFANFFYTTTLFWPVEVHQKKENCNKIAQIDLNSPKFRIIFAIQYTGLKKYTTASRDGHES